MMDVFFMTDGIWMENCEMSVTAQPCGVFLIMWKFWTRLDWNGLDVQQE